MKKVLFTATVDSHILHFHIPYLKYFKEKGYEVHVASNGQEKIPYCDVKYDVCFERSPLKLNNLKAKNQLKKIIDEQKYDVIHCHTPVASVLTRIVAKKSRKENNTKVIYTAHGFHFFKGAPIQNWLFFYPIEKAMAKHTDVLITINMEDYELAKKKFKTKQIEYIPGIGVDEEKFHFDITQNEKHNIRNKLHLNDEDFVCIQVGELNKNKNQIMTLNAIRPIIEQNKNVKLLLVGTGNLEEYYREKIKQYNLEENILLLGYRKDVKDLLEISNLLISTSKREGLPVNIMEAMLCGKPIIATDCRGNRDLVKNKENGFIVKINDVNTLKDKILEIKNNEQIREQFSKKSKEIVKLYSIENVFKEIKEKNIYGI